MAVPGTKTVAIFVHTAEGRKEIPTDDVVAMTLEPYPVVVLRLPDGKLLRYANFPVELHDEEASVVKPHGVHLVPLVPLGRG